MDKRIVLALFAAVVGWTIVPARAETPSEPTKCSAVVVPVTLQHKKVQAGDLNTVEIPRGWTPVGAGSSPGGHVVVVCKPGSRL